MQKFACDGRVAGRQVRCGAELRRRLGSCARPLQWWLLNCANRAAGELTSDFCEPNRASFLSINGDWRCHTRRASVES